MGSNACLFTVQGEKPAETKKPVKEDELARVGWRRVHLKFQMQGASSFKAESVKTKTRPTHTPASVPQNLEFKTSAQWKFQTQNFTHKI